MKHRRARGIRTCPVAGKRAFVSARLSTWFLRSAADTRRKRRGGVLLIVLVIIVLLSLGAYTFTEISIAENEATRMYGRGVLARNFAESGIDLVATVLADPVERRQADPVYNRPDLFGAVLMRNADVPRGRGRFSVVAPMEQDPSGRSVRFGLVDESGKLNLNTLLNTNPSATTARMSFMYLPNMTYEIADAILDWLDTDDQPRQFGAESDYYLSLPQPYRPASGPLSSLDELLLVRGVTPALLWGEDLNRNGILDPGEDMNGDGFLDRGWSAYLTISSAEHNVRFDGSARINVNNPDLPALFNQINGELGQTAAVFITACRINAVQTSSAGSGSGSGNGGGGSGGSSSTSMSSSSGGGSGGGGGGGGSGGGSSGGGGSGGRSNSNSSTSNPPNSVMLGGLAVPPTGNQTINSIYQLIGSSVTARINGRNTTLRSPWPATTASVAQSLPDLLDRLTTVPDEFIQGRINVNRASYVVLEGIPNMTQNLADQILAAQMSGGAGSSTSGSGVLNPRATTAWMVIEGLTTVSMMQKLDPYLTAHGDVYRVQSVGFFDDGGPVVRLEAVIDSSIQPPRILNLRDLSDLGRGYNTQQLGVR